MVVLGYVLYDDDELTLTSPTQAEYTAGCPRETFATTQVVNVTNTTAKELTATLDRIVVPDPRNNPMRDYLFPQIKYSQYGQHSEEER